MDDRYLLATANQMKQTRYITTTIQVGNRLEIDLPNIPIPQSGGYANEVILIIPDASDSNLQSIDRRSFIKLSILETDATPTKNAVASEHNKPKPPYLTTNRPKQNGNNGLTSIIQQALNNIQKMSQSPDWALARRARNFASWSRFVAIDNGARIENQHRHSSPYLDRDRYSKVR
ncbi:hypothetical protein Cha6605_1535 [Chamaesiphon minutus PCC 6605]|uniref:Uncharacterized protein n=1 Tax=Chamaesiphon minutus (strain ATCC 27169 / PCC 6605) TaxID=1173020 RepID=K9UER1_CHAP6|nr:hypothetical protein Cha6605_1535 [Chamaesiphon minutus PCC 6605]